MKTQILRLDPHDDLISTRDKMNWGQTGRILLVWPEKGRLLRRRLDLVILQRHSLALGAQLALVTADPLVSAHARLLAIPVFNSLHQAQSAHWRVERRRRPRSPARSLLRLGKHPDEIVALRRLAHPAEPAWSTRPVVRLGIFALAVFSVLALAAILLPGAEIHLVPRTKTQEIELGVRASPGQQGVNLSGILPAHVLTAVVEGREEVDASGLLQVPDQPATGSIVLTNLSDRPVRIPANLVIRTPTDPAIRFMTIQAADLEAGPGITATLSIRAITPGTMGNLPKDSLTAIEGDLGLVLAASNPRSTQGGRNRQVPVPTTSDRQRLYEKLASALETSALEDLQAQLNPGDLLFTSTLSLTQVLDEVYDPPEDQPSGRLQLNLRLEYRALAAMDADLQRFANVLLDANLPEGYLAQADTLTVQPLSPPSVGPDGDASWRIVARRKLAAAIPTEQAIALVLGADLPTAARRLAADFPLEEPPRIRLVPSWWPRLPILPFRITVAL